MDQEKFGKLIKEIRKKNGLTQNELANKYNVTYQAVSKWENGKNLPDMALIKQIAQDFNVSLDDMLGVPKKKKNYIWIISLIVFVVALILIFMKPSSFKFKTLSSSCDNFNLSGSIFYNNNRSAIHITNIEYCGESDLTEYKEISCTLYEKNNKIINEISKCDDGYNTKLYDFLKNVDIEVSSYANICKEFNNNSLYLEINAIDNNDRTTSYKIPLKLNDTCTKQ